jgi:hypothetical protein
LTFVPGITSLTFTVPIIDDTLYEPTETFFLNLSNATNASIADNQATASILASDVPPTVSIQNTNTIEGNALTFTVSLSGPSQLAVTATFTALDGTATIADNDYIAAPSTTLIFAPGETVKTFTVNTVLDSKVEANETVILNVNVVGSDWIASAQAVGTIMNDYDQTIPSLVQSTPTPPTLQTPTVVTTISISTPLLDPHSSTSLFAIKNIQLPTITTIAASNKLAEIVVSDFTRTKFDNEEVAGYFTIYLTVKPEAAVTIDLEGVNLPEGSLSQKSVTFTPDNWNNPIMVEVKKDLVRGDESTGREKVLTKPAKSRDSDFDNVKANDVDIHTAGEQPVNVGEVQGEDNEPSNTADKGEQQTENNEDFKTAMVILYENQ